MSGARRQRQRLFAVPGLIAAATLVGLIAGVLGDGLADMLSWLALGSSPAIIGWALLRRRD